MCRSSAVAGGAGRVVPAAPDFLVSGGGAAEHPAFSGTAVYNVDRTPYNVLMVETSHVMTVSRNGQVSIPAETRARWKTRQVLVVDLGDRVVMRPVGDDPVRHLRGKYAKQGPTTSRARGDSRREDADRAAHR